MTTTVYVRAIGNKAVKVKQIAEDGITVYRELTIQPNGTDEAEIGVHGEQTVTVQETGDFV